MNETLNEPQKKEAEVHKGVEHTRARKVYAPDVDIIERKDDIVVIADLPGADNLSVDITVEKNILTLYAKTEPFVPERHRLTIAEYGVGDYHRVFTLSDEIDKEKIRATVKNGVLKVSLPKAESAKTKKIPVITEN